MKYPVILVITLIFFCSPLTGQDPAGKNESAGDLYFNFRNLNFVKNNEYSNPITEGYTLIGYFLNPELIYNADEKVTLRLGAHLQSYSGTKRFTDILPVFSTTWHFNPQTCFTIGSLSGSDEHNMLDPHFSSERTYIDNHEDGLQFRISTDRIFTDTWLSWENYIFKGDNEREIFTAGESFRYLSPRLSGLLSFEIPVQIQFKHYGGQISNYPEHVETFLNLAAGIKLNLYIKGSEYGTAGGECLFFSGSSLTDNASSGISSGHAGWYRLFYSFRHAEINAGLWKSHEFYAPNGNYIFGSVSDHYENLVIPDRKIITCSASLLLAHKEFLEFFFAFDGYYDTDLNRFDNAVTIHLKFDRMVKLSKR